ncbi:MAG: hypothetical protein U9N79_05605 [Actinomycetota bacterium]|nr:hypothetical protein [Actinomycetota bacterium]
MRKRIFVMLAVLATAFAIVPAASATGDHPGLTPESVDAVIFPGGDFVVEKTVHTPEIPPSVDVCLLEDETGSFSDDIANLQNPVTIQAIYDGVTAEAPDAQFAVAGFRDYNVAPHGSGDDWVYQLYSSMSPDFSDWENGVNALSAGGGYDGPEAQFDAIVAAVTGPTDYVPDSVGEQADCGWRDDDTVTRVLVVTTDAAFHLPGAGKPHANDLASTVAALDADDVVVVGLKTGSAGGELDALAAATGGSVQPLSNDGSNIADAIIAGLEDIEIDVTMASNCEWPISTTFSPDSLTVTSGDDAVFTETILVAADAPGGTYTCTDQAFIDGAEMVDDAGAVIYETKTINVPEGFLTGGGQIGKGKTAENFGGNVGFLADFSVVGQWQFRDGAEKLNMHSLSIDTLQFYMIGGEPADPPAANANAAYFAGTARVKDGTAKWIDTCTFEAWAEDHGEPQAADAFAISIDCGDDGNWAYGQTPLDTGNLQIHSGVKE